VIADLRPSHLDDLGLPAAVRWYASEVQSRAPLAVSVEVIGEPRPIPSAVKTALFRVVQEALTNVARHAQVASAQVRLRREADRVSLRVQDRGVGFDPGTVLESAEEGGGFGLRGMRDRVRLLAGRFGLRSSPGKGTVVEVEVPLEGEGGR
jgi:signal transduction histidine kinase